MKNIFIFILSFLTFILNKEFLISEVPHINFNSNLLTFFDIFIYILCCLIVIVMVFLNISIYTLAERKTMASIQRRNGPNVQGIYGFLQPFSDGLKLCLKEIVIPKNVNIFLFFFSPVFFLSISISMWCLIPFYLNISLVDIPYTLFFFYLLSTFSVYGIIFAGWSSNSYYSVLGSLRAVSQLISYDLVIGVIYTIFVMCIGSSNLSDIIFFQRYVWFIFPFFPLFLIYFICALAETNRIPFDLPEAESELVAGYNVEYSSIIFAMFFLAEYSNMMIMSFLIVFLFFGGWLTNFYFLKVIFFLFLFILVRSILPRYRYDQLIDIGWNILLPLVFGFFIFFLFFFYSFDSFGFNPIENFYSF